MQDFQIFSVSVKEFASYEKKIVFEFLETDWLASIMLRSDLSGRMICWSPASSRKQLLEVEGQNWRMNGVVTLVKTLAKATVVMPFKTVALSLHAVGVLQSTEKVIMLIGSQHCKFSPWLCTHTLIHIPAVSMGSAFRVHSAHAQLVWEKAWLGGDIRLTHVAAFDRK